MLKKKKIMRICCLKKKFNWVYSGKLNIIFFIFNEIFFYQYLNKVKF